MWNPGNIFSPCCQDDAPSVSAMMTLFTKLLELPEELTTPQQRAEWQAFADRIPSLPTWTPTPSGPAIAAAAVISQGVHNSEGPELYPIHPHRVFTKGKEVATGFDISLGVNTVATSNFTGSNTGARLYCSVYDRIYLRSQLIVTVVGWNYGLNAAALIGLTQTASTLVS